MNELHLYLGITFLFFYLRCIHKNPVHKAFFIFAFIVFSFILRFSIDVSWGKDYMAYYHLYRMEKPEKLLDYFTKEPYLYLLHTFCSNLLDTRKEVFQLMFYFNFIIVNSFFIWLIWAENVRTWKKMIFFSLYYLLFSYVLLRNGIPYVIFAYFIHQIYNDKKTTKLVYLTPFMHFSSTVPIVLIFHKSKKYFYYFTIVFSLLVSVIFVGTLLNRPELELINSKFNAYSEKQIFSIIYYIFFAVFMSATFVAYLFLRKRFFHPVIITTLALYILVFFISPIAAFRYSPYLLTGLIFIRVDDTKYKRFNNLMDYASIVILFHFIYTFYDTHEIS